MNKYLIFILIGIILFILNNKVNGFSIGIPEYEFTIVGEEINLSNVQDDGIMAVEDNPVFQDDAHGENRIYVYGKDENDARRKLKRHMDLIKPGATLIDINLTTPAIDVDQNDKTNVVCKPNYRCNLDTFGKIFKSDITHNDCNDAFEMQLDIDNCKEYHNINNCIQNCTFVNENNNTRKTLEKDGFQKMPQLVNVNYRVTDSMEMVEESMEPNFKTFYTTFDNFRESYSDNGFLYSEYVFKRFLESIYPDSNLHKISDGLYFINGKIIICRNKTNNLRIRNIRTTIWNYLTPEQQRAATTLSWTSETWNKMENNDSLFVRIPNWENLNAEQIQAATTLGWTSETWGKNVPYSKFYFSSGHPVSLLHMDFQKYITYDSINNAYGNQSISRTIDGKTSKYHFINSINIYNNGIKFISNENSKSINLWLLLEGSDGIKTMGFIDIIDDDDNNKYNADTLRDMQANDLAIQIDDRNKYSMVPFPGRLTPYFEIDSTQYPNVLNIQTMNTTMDIENNPDQTKPNINPNILYTYNMTPGDVLAFRSDIPHIGFTDDRISIEFRYDYFEIDLPVSEYIETLSSVCGASTKTYIDIKDDILIGQFDRFIIEDDIQNKDTLYVNIITEIFKFFREIYNKIKDEYLKNSSSKIPDDLFFKFLEFLNTKLTLNLDTNNNPDYQDNLDRLNQYIAEFLNLPQ